MSTEFTLVWTPEARNAYDDLADKAAKSREARASGRKNKAAPAEGLFKQVVKCLALLRSNPRHPGLQTHEFTSIDNPYTKREKVWEAHVQQKTQGAYRLFWCYGPDRGQITVIAITPHP